MNVDHQTRLHQPLINIAVVMLWLAVTIVTPRAAQADSRIDVPLSELLPVVRAELEARGADPGSEIVFATPTIRVPQAIVAAGSDAIHSLAFTPASGRFLIRFSAPGTQNVFAVTGRTVVSKTIPVLIHPVARNEALSEDNIDWLTTSDVLPAGIVTEATLLHGKTAKRALPAGVALRMRDIAKPVLISRGALITMAYARKGLKISHRAIAEQSGGLGDVIEVRNPMTDRRLRAMVEGKNRVAVIGPVSPSDQRSGRQSR